MALHSPPSPRRTLGDLGLGPDCVLQLHSLAPSSPSPRGEGPEAERAAPALPPLNAEAVSRQLDTRIPPRDTYRGAHSFAGIIFDVHACSEREVMVTSVHVAGMLGRVRIFARECTWRDDEEETERRTVFTGWGHHYEMNERGWALVHDEQLPPSWNTAREVRLQQPVRIMPHHTRALFVHSNLPDDLGIQYQEWRPADVVAADDTVQILPGLGFTGQVPFDHRHGWYRQGRGPAGGISYTSQPVYWNMRSHAGCPAELQGMVRTMLCVHAQPESTLHVLPAHLLLYMLEFLRWDWAVTPGSVPAQVLGVPSRSVALNDDDMEEDEEDEEDWEEDSDEE